MKETRRKRLTKNNGITLIALVVTIVVLLILAGISINLVIGQNGIITHAKTAKIETKAATVSDERDMWMNDRYLAEQLGETPKTMNAILEELQGKRILTEEDVQTIKSDSNNAITIGSKTISFKVSEKTDLSQLKIGDYVNYTYDEITTGYPLAKGVSGYTSDQTITQPATALRWRILNINGDGSIDLVSEKATDKAVNFRGALGYNNGVYALHEMCATLFSNATMGITARSINIEDIEKHETPDGKSARLAYKEYGNTKTYTSFRSYPNLYSYQNGSGINSTEVKKDGISESEKTADGYTMPTTEQYSDAGDKGLTVTQTLYENVLNGTNYGAAGEVLYNSNSGSIYWVASRFTDCLSDYPGFGLRNAGNMLAWTGLLFPNSGAYPVNYRLRPVVSLKPNAIDTSLGKDANGAWQLKIK